MARQTDVTTPLHPCSEIYKAAAMLEPFVGSIPHACPPLACRARVQLRMSQHGVGNLHASTRTRVHRFR
ncbi:hypothetical protein HaLaN_12040 [Haematococcus lacustris]|uniref:Uncharacterized protein n=1 Tax=Haematococcus lacustris TaxID=44745 RepID=A0A699Z290_HAELA|nr:hypothetical protein HaLaN_12040 [Haematococcus lacustris]